MNPKAPLRSALAVAKDGEISQLSQALMADPDQQQNLRTKIEGVEPHEAKVPLAPTGQSAT